ncbi:MAG: hypothetical protein WD802_00500 [Gemmatimonadaceae bacterium]
MQYNDFVGSSAADRAGIGGPEDWLRERKLMQSDDFVLGIEIWAGENDGVHRDPITVHFLLVKGSFDSAKETIGSSSRRVPVRRVTVDIGVAEFMGLFKRFSVAISPGGMLNDKTYEYTEE